MPVFTSDGCVFNTTFLLPKSKVWNEYFCGCPVISKVSNVCPTHIAQGLPQFFSPDHVLCLAFLPGLSWNTLLNLHGSFCLSLSPVSHISLSGLTSDTPKQESHLEPRVCTPQNSVTPITTNAHCHVPPSHWSP